MGHPSHQECQDLPSKGTGQAPKHPMAPKQEPQAVAAWFGPLGSQPGRNTLIARELVDTLHQQSKRAHHGTASVLDLCCAELLEAFLVNVFGEACWVKKSQGSCSAHLRAWVKGMARHRCWLVGWPLANHKGGHSCNRSCTNDASCDLRRLGSPWCGRRHFYTSQLGTCAAWCQEGLGLQGPQGQLLRCNLCSWSAWHKVSLLPCLSKKKLEPRQSRNI